MSCQLAIDPDSTESFMFNSLLQVTNLGTSKMVGWPQDNGNGSNQKSKFDFLSTCQQLVRDNKKKNCPLQPTIKFTFRKKTIRRPCLGTSIGSCKSIFSLCWHHPNRKFQQFETAVLSVQKEDHTPTRQL